MSGRNNICFKCRRTARRESGISARCPECGNDMHALRQNSPPIPKRSDVEGWRFLERGWSVKRRGKSVVPEKGKFTMSQARSGQRVGFKIVQRGPGEVFEP